MITLLAIDVPSDIKSKLKAASAALQPFGEDTDWLTPDQMHIQVAYIGNVPPSFMGHLCDTVRQTLGEGGFGTIRCRAKGLGFYGSRRYMASIWCAVEPNAILKAIYEALWTQLRKLGYTPVHGVDFHARVNLAFCKGRTRNEKLVDELAAFEESDFGAWPATSLNLLEQSKGPKGFRYKSLYRFPM